MTSLSVRRGNEARYPWRSALRRVDVAGLPNAACAKRTNSLSDRSATAALTDEAEGSVIAALADKTGGRCAYHNLSSVHCVPVMMLVPLKAIVAELLENTVVQPMAAKSTSDSRDRCRMLSGKTYTSIAVGKCGTHIFPEAIDDIYCPLGNETVIGCRSHLFITMCEASEARKSV